ncbi:MAG TPA: non-homologous end-joining DNA ligase [Candidatus Rubrimentiphilum sp.]|nr:non-homologous end-joining DNA ligase [Candidatus Rubrimentiphilum sp.]
MPAKKTTRGASRSKEPGSLTRYHQKRDFKETPEPRGARAKPAGRLKFVIQKHRATRLHYDFRLEADGVLKSWAIPKGPSLNTTDRRLAMHVEDHPMDYRTFEGIIPRGQYGAGEVIVWDQGTYKLAEGTDPAAEIGRGKIKFILFGKKMHGEFTLVRIKGRGGEGGDPWLLIKDKDEYVNPKYNIEKDNKSVKTGRTVESYADDPRARHWNSGRKASGSRAPKEKKSAKRDPIPVIHTPMLATLVDEAFDDDDWFFEIKWDGYRAICTVRENGNMTLVSRNGLDFLHQFPELKELRNAWTTLPIVVDGEIVSLDEKGRSSFQRLQGSFNRNRPSARSAESKKYPLTYVAFDLLYADGKDFRKLPLEERKERLQRAIADDELVLYSKHVVGRGCAFFEQAQRQQLEGIIGKLRTSIYQERRTRDWVKIKAQLMQECVIGGFTEPRGSRKGFGALLLGLYDKKKLYYVGHVGTGFNTKLLALLTARLKKLERKTSPFANEVVSNMKAHWVEPKLVAQVRFTEWTRDNYMRQPAFLGLREDKDPKECMREIPIDTDEVA